MYRLISGLIRKTGYSRGSDRKVRYHIMGSSTGIRMNERITYTVREAAKTSVGAINTSDATMKADTLLASIINISNESLIYNASSLAANSDVENFIPSLAIEYGEFQDAINSIEEYTGANLIIDTNDVAQFRYELRNTVGGRGFTIKNKYVPNNTDEADDTMYLRGKDWDYEESAYKSDSYSSSLFTILPSESTPGSIDDLGFNPNLNIIANPFNSTNEQATKFRPTHSRWLPGDIFVNINQISSADPWDVRLRICTDSGGLPLNTGGIVANIEVPASSLVKSNPNSNSTVAGYQIVDTYKFLNTSLAPIASFNLNTNQDYWLIFSSYNNPASSSSWTLGCQDSLGSNNAIYKIGASRSSGSASSNTNGGTGWAVNTFAPLIGLPRRRSIAFNIKDPKAIANLGSGLPTGGSVIESSVPISSSIVKTTDAMYKHLTNQLYFMGKPRANFSMSRVTAPNIPVYPGDPIIISDTVLGFSASGGQAVIAKCGDMTYTWNIGEYQAPTILNIQPVTTVTRYK
jgi:hypothetical protein